MSEKLSNIRSEINQTDMKLSNIKQELSQMKQSVGINYLHKWSMVNGQWSMVNGQWFIVSCDSANKQKHHKSHRMQ